MDARSDSEETVRLLERAGGGDRDSFDRLFARHRGALEEMIDRRLDARLRARLDASDVVQDAQLEAYRRLPDFLRRRPMPFRLWVWKTAYERLLNLRRDHAAARRSVGREAPLPEQSSLLLARRLFVGSPSPSEEAVRREQAQQVRRALDRLADADREVLLLRYLDGLSNEEAAQVLEVNPGTASKRHGRAILKLHQILVALGAGEGSS